MDARRVGLRVLFQRWSRRSVPSAVRPRFLEAAVLLVCGGVLLQAFALEPFQVPTGSMAPALLGRHRACACPHCGMTVVVGRPRADRDGRGGERYYAKAFCPNCGELVSHVGQAPETAGDQVLVNKAAFAFRQPRRWEVVVFRLFGMVFIKRVVGLPGESLMLRDGDVYVDGKLARKTFAQARTTCVPVFEQRFQPVEGWGERWEFQPDDGTNEGPDLLLDGRLGRQTLTFRNGLPVDGKYPPFHDEYAYNGGLLAGSEPVHDFLIEADVEALAGQGTLALRLCDGQDLVEVTLPVGRRKAMEMRTWPANAKRPAIVEQQPRCSEAAGLLVGRSHRVEMAFVDRRFSVSVDGRLVVDNVDLPEPGQRDAVDRPVQLEAHGAAVAIRNFRLCRDVHYTARGTHAVGGEAVLLGVEQYFVLGDNSPNSEDSRFWPDGAVSASQMLGPAFLVHLPSQPLRWQVAGWSWQGQMPNVARIRWLW
jgi:signal peptidase I